MKRHELMVLMSLAVIPFGIASSLYSASAGYIAGALGLSADEASWLNLCYTAAQLMTLPLASWWVYRFSAGNLLVLGALIGLSSNLLAAFTLWTPLHFVAWTGLGMAASCLLLGAQVMLLRHLPRRELIYAQGSVLLLTTLLPAGLYPWLIAELAERDLWQLPFALQLLLYVLLLGGLLIYPRVESPEHQSTVQFNLLQALLVTLFLGVLTYILMRGNVENWFDSTLIVNWSLAAGVLLLLSVYALRWRWGRGEYLRTDVLIPNRNKVAMYNAALAGFAALGTSILLGNYMGSVLKYSASEQGWVQLPALAAMLLGLVISLWISYQPRLKVEIVIPFGVLLIMISSILLSNSSVYSDAPDMLPALLLRGLGIGLLNVAVTISILLSFERQHIPQGVSYFYLARTLGGLAGSALFARLMSVESTSTLNILAEQVNPLNTAFVERQQLLGQALQQVGEQVTPDRVAALLSSQLQTQTAAVVGINNFQWLVLCLCLLGPVLVLGKIWAAKSQS